MKLPNMLVILSAERADLNSDQNENNTRTLNTWLREAGFKYERASGVYEGTEEKSFVVQADDFAQVGTLVELAARWSQESIMLVDARDHVFLYYLEERNLVSRGVLYQSTLPPAGASTLLNNIYYYAI